MHRLYTVSSRPRPIGPIRSSYEAKLAKLRLNYIRFLSLNNDRDQTIAVFKGLANLVILPRAIGFVYGTHIS